MLVSCWSAKGGTGTTVVAVALATRARPTATLDGAVLADLAGDRPCRARTARARRPGPRRVAGRRPGRPGRRAGAASRWRVRPGLAAAAAGPGAPRRSRPGRGAGGAARRGPPGGGGRRRAPHPRTSRRGPPTEVAGSLAVAAGAGRRCWSPGAATSSCAGRPQLPLRPSGRRAGRRAGPGCCPLAESRTVLGVPVLAEVPVEPGHPAGGRLAACSAAGCRVGSSGRCGACRVSAGSGTGPTGRGALAEALHRDLLDTRRPEGSPRSSGPGCVPWPARAIRCSPGCAVDAVVEAVRARVDGLGPLEPVLADPAVDEVMVNGGGEVWVERGGRLGLHGARASTSPPSSPSSSASSPRSGSTWTGRRRSWTPASPTARG